MDDHIIALFVIVGIILLILVFSCLKYVINKKSHRILHPNVFNSSSNNPTNYNYILSGTYPKSQPMTQTMYTSVENTFVV